MAQDDLPIYWCGTEQSWREYLAEREHWRRCYPELYALKLDFEQGRLNQPLAGSLEPMTGLGQRHLGDETPPRDFYNEYDAWAVIQMNNLAIGLTPYLPPYPKVDSF